MTPDGEELQHPTYASNPIMTSRRVFDEVNGMLVSFVEEKSEWVAAKNLGKDELVNISRC